MAERSQPRICLLTPGPYSETYFEQAYLARYLGFLLVEGDDLVVHDGQVHVRTIAGLEARRRALAARRRRLRRSDRAERRLAPRRAAAAVGDPRRQHGGRQHAGRGLRRVARAARLHAAVCRHLLGEDLAMPNIATWWCGQAERAREGAERSVADVDRRRLRRARAGLRRRAACAAGDAAGGGRRAAARGDRGARRRLCRPGGRAAVDHAGVGRRTAAAAAVRAARLRRGDAGRLAGHAGRLLPDLGEGRRARRQHGRGRAVRRRVGAVATSRWCWRRCCRRSEEVSIRRILGNLPSRAADNLFWYGRYLERAEATLRIVRCLCGRSVDST